MLFTASKGARSLVTWNPSSWPSTLYMYGVQITPVLPPSPFGQTTASRAWLYANNLALALPFGDVVTVMVFFSHDWDKEC